jgi:trehalose-phosphatase
MIDWVVSVHTAYLAGRPIVCLFDYDGTLSPIVSHPSLAVLSKTVQEDLRQLAGVEGVSVGVISGRALADVRQMVGLEGLLYAGSSGAEIDLWGTRLNSLVTPEARALLETAVREIRATLPNFPGVWIEEKPAGFTVHYRGAAPAVAVRFHDNFRWLIARFRDLRSLWVCEAYEVSLADAWDKGTAVEFILAKLPNVFPVYVGDSENDRPGMIAVQSVGGVTVAVGESAPSCATYRHQTTDEFHGELSRLRELLTRGSQSTATEGAGCCYPVAAGDTIQPAGTSGA